MWVIAEPEELALSLSDYERTRLAEKPIPSLPGPFVEDDNDVLKKPFAVVRKWWKTLR